jgi:RND family efflux transporter MFP subunit
MQRFSGTCFIIAALALLSGCRAEPTVAASAPETIIGLHILPVRQTSMPDVFQASGSVRSWRTAPLAAQVMANVVAVKVREGDPVRRGQVLVTMDASQFLASADRDSAGLRAAEHEIASAQSDLDLARANYKRLDYLFQKEIISAREYDDAKAKLDSAGARLELARANREQAAASLNQQKILLGYTSVLAPFDGVVTERRVDPGALATPGLPLLTVEEAGHYRLEVTVDERDLKYVQLGKTVAAAFDSLDGPPLSSKIVQIVPAADPASRSFIVKLDLPQVSGLRSGLFGRAAFSRGQKEAVAVPAGAVLDRGQLQSVYVVAGGNIATLRYVTLGSRTDGQVEVLSGLAPGDLVIADPAGRDLAGKRVEVR